MKCAVCSDTYPSYRKKEKPHPRMLVLGRSNGTRGGGRTLNLRLRRPTLYPIELLAQDVTKIGQTPRRSNLILLPTSSGIEVPLKSFHTLRQPLAHL
jgi:hypothetical protein